MINIEWTPVVLLSPPLLLPICLLVLLCKVLWIPRWWESQEQWRTVIMENEKCHKEYCTHKLRNGEVNRNPSSVGLPKDYKWHHISTFYPAVMYGMLAKIEAGMTSCSLWGCIKQRWHWMTFQGVAQPYDPAQHEAHIVWIWGCGYTKS